MSFVALMMPLPRGEHDTDGIAHALDSTLYLRGSALSGREGERHQGVDVEWINRSFRELPLGYCRKTPCFGDLSPCKRLSVVRSFSNRKTDDRRCHSCTFAQGHGLKRFTLLAKREIDVQEAFREGGRPCWGSLNTPSNAI